MSGSAELVRGAGLNKHYGGIVANVDMDFTVEEGDLIGLIGPNGSGKTTLINILTGHLAPDSGEIFVGGQRTNGRPPHIYAAMGVARSFQVTQLFGRMTVLENLLVPGLTRRHSRREAVVRHARETLEFLHMGHVEQLEAKNLSGGQQKLLELGRCLMLEPSVLFLDEPFAGVHPTLRDELILRIQELHQQGRTFVVVDHDMESILRLSRRLVVMARGSKIADGPPAEVQANQAVLAAYVGL
jgi:ABC-type branched-subunit amino acid transport system ATPase component